MAGVRTVAVACSYVHCGRALNSLYKSRPHFVAGENCPLHQFPLCCTWSCSPLSCLESLKPVKGTCTGKKECVGYTRNAAYSRVIDPVTGRMSLHCVLWAWSPKKWAAFGRGLKKCAPSLPLSKGPGWSSKHDRNPVQSQTVASCLFYSSLPDR